MELPADLQSWLLTEGDPSVQFRILRDVLDLPEGDARVETARAAVGKKGWASDILRWQLEGGQWTTPGTTALDLYRPKYITTNWMLLVLSDLGLTRKDPRVARAAELLLNRSAGGEEDSLGGPGSHLCFTGNAVRMMVRFGYGDDPRVRRAIAWLLSAQKPDGGWHCFPSDTGSLSSWEALAALAVLPPAARTPDVTQAIQRGLEFYLSRGLLQEGGQAYAPWLRLHYPNHYYYDALVGLDIVTALGAGSDPRIQPALDWLESKRNPADSWNLDALHPDIEEDLFYWARGVKSPFFPFGLEIPGQPSRWLTATALTVLHRAGRL